MKSRSNLLCGTATVIIIGIGLVGMGFLIVSKPNVLWDTQLTDTSLGLGEHPDILIGKHNYVLKIHFA